MDSQGPVGLRSWGAVETPGGGFSPPDVDLSRPLGKIFLKMESKLFNTWGRIVHQYCVCFLFGFCHSQAKKLL